MIKHLTIILAFSYFSTVNAADLCANFISLVIVQYPEEIKDYPYGHAALRVSGAGYDNLYELCAPGNLERGVGNGVLKLWKNASDGILDRTNNGAWVEIYKISSTPEQNILVNQHFHSLHHSIKNDSKLFTDYEPNKLYHFLDNNCVVMVLTLFEKATGIKLPVNNQGSTLSNRQYLGLCCLHHLKYCLWPTHTFLPGDLGAVLENDTRFERTTTGNHIVIDIGL